MFPSSKRIYRAQSLSPDDNSTIAADVCALHRDREIWGPDALLFRPARFDEINKTPESSAAASMQRAAYLPFGLSPHLCPAYHGFGERMIFVLVLVLRARLGPENASLKFNDEILDSQIDTELPTGRYDMEGWVLTRK